MPLDRASAQTVTRLCLTLSFIGMVCLLGHALTKAPVTPVPLLRVAAMVAAGFALAHRERPYGPSLNRWDEALVCFGLAGLARIVGA